MPDERFYAFFYGEGFNHMLAHEVSQISYGLHRDRLVEKLKRLLAVNAQEAAKMRTVLRKVVEDLHTGLIAQASAQIGKVRSEPGEVLGDGELFVGDNVKPIRLSLPIGLPKDLRQGDVLLVAGIAEVAQDHRVRVVVAQGDRFGAQPVITARCFIVAQDIRA